MSPIFVRPVREQLEHDRLIRFLQVKYKRKFEVGANVGDEQVAPVKLSGRAFFPDLVLTDGKKLAGLVEVESAESVNNLEAMAQWVHFSAARVPFHLYVPVTAFDAARRLCEAHKAPVTEIWTYRPSLDGFDLMRMHHDTGVVARRPAAKAAPAPAPAKTAAPKPARPAAGVAKPAKKAARPAPKPAAKRPAKKAPPKKKSKR